MAKIRKINVSEIAGRSPFAEDNNAIMPAGTIVVYEGNNAGEYALRIHDGVTDGGIPLGESSIGNLIVQGNTTIANGMSQYLDLSGPVRLGNDTGNIALITSNQSTEETHQWTFNTDGNLTLPLGGDILDSNGVSVLGGGSGVDNNIWVETFALTDPEESIVAIATSVEYDADGNIFALFSHLIPGVDNETYKSVAKLTPTGAVLWQVRFGANLNTDGWGLAYDGSDSVYIAGSTSGADLDYTLATLTKIDAADGISVWSKTYDFEATSRSAVVDVDSDGNPIMVGWADTPGGENNRIITTKVDQADGSVVWSRTLDGQGDDEAYGMAVGPTGEVVAVGYMSQYDEVLASHSVTPLTGSGVNVLVINRSDLSGDTFTDTWQVAGTGITGTIGVNDINAYTGLTGTVRQGSGATFDFVIAGDGSITNPVTVANGGTNYLPGHKIKIPYTLISGADANSDIILTVTGTTDGVITSVAAGFYGGGAGTPNTYSAVAGTNYQTGSGLTFDLELDSGSTYTEHPFNITAAGTNYANGDVVVVSGTQLGGTSPANDLTITVSTDAGGVTTFNSFTGTQQTTTFRVVTEDAGINFGGTGTWTLNDISIDTTARMTVVKYAADGTIAWQKAVQFESNYDCKGADADIDSDGNIYVCGEYNNYGGSAMSLVKFNSSGVKQWSRQVIGNCEDFATSVVVGPNNNLYLSGVTIDDANEDIVWVVAKYTTGGTVVWQRLIDNTASWTFAGGTFIGEGGGSNIAVGPNYVALGGGFGTLEAGDDPTAAVVQIDTAGTPFSIGDWDLTGASFSGTLDDTASNITVVNAGKVSGTATPTVEDFNANEDDSNFLSVTRYSLSGADSELTNGEYTFALSNTGNLTLPAGGTITEGVVTSNPTIQLTPANPTVASQKLVIKGGAAYSAEDNGIFLTWNEINPQVTDTVTIYVLANSYTSQTLYWWIEPADVIADPGFGTVEIDGSGNGVFTFTVNSADYEFTVRVSPEDNNYDPDSIGVETQLFNADAPTYGDQHLHLTTGDLTETSIILGTDNHNVRTTVDGGVEINTYLYPSGGGSGKWTFDNNGVLTLPGIGTFTIGESEPGMVFTSSAGFGFVSNVDGITSPTLIFGTDGVLTLPGEGVIRSIDDTVTLSSLNTSTGNVNSVYLGSSGGLGFNDQAIGGNWLEIFRNGAEPEIRTTVGNINIQTANGSTPYNWTFSNTGNLTLPETGYLRVGSGIVAGFAASPAPVISGFSSVSAQNFRFQGNGVNILSNVVSKTAGSWTVTTGTNTYSFTVPSSGTYQLWVECNIPNGILVWNATATITNSNVPVVGAQYAWVYDGGGSPIDFTSIPNQFTGTANTIVRSSSAPSSNTNRFDFGLNNTSDGNVTVSYGYVKIS